MLLYFYFSKILNAGLVTEYLGKRRVLLPPLLVRQYIQSKDVTSGFRKVLCNDIKRYFKDESTLLVSAVVYTFKGIMNTCGRSYL